MCGELAELGLSLCRSHTSRRTAARREAPVITFPSGIIGPSCSGARLSGGRVLRSFLRFLCSCGLQ